MGASAGRERRRGAAFLLYCLLALTCVCVVDAGSHRAAAQEGSAAAAGEETKSKNPFFTFVKAMPWGWVFTVIFVLTSIGLVFLIVLLALDLRMGVAIPPPFVEEFTDVVNKRQFKQAYELARQENSYLGRVLTAGMSRLQYGLEDAREAASNMVDTIRAGKDQMISYLAVVGTLGPLFGLVGTVVGMIKAFSELGEAAGGKPPEFPKLAAALSEALVVTLVGISLSLPAIFFHTFFRNRLATISNDTANIGDDLLTQMYHNSKRPATPAAPAAAPAPAADARSSPAPAVRSAEG